MAGGLSRAVGYVLPIRRALTKAEGEGWVSEAWRFRREGLFLLPGDSPVGLRLPLGALPEVAPKDYPYITPVDPYEARGPLPSFDEVFDAATPAIPAKPKKAKPPIVRTALTCEVRKGVLYIFMPPVARLA